jgi:hypothetical protein
MPPAGFEPAIPADERLQTTGIGMVVVVVVMMITQLIYEANNTRRKQ